MCDFQKSVPAVTNAEKLWNMWVCPSNHYQKLGVVRLKKHSY